VSPRSPLPVSTRSRSLTSIEDVTRAIVVLRGRKVLLDAELAALYGVTTKRLNEQVKRNAERFPKDFMFRLSRRDCRPEPVAFCDRFAKASRSALSSLRLHGARRPHGRDNPEQPPRRRDEPLCRARIRSATLTPRHQQVTCSEAR
jgi:hypothetical protein